MSKHIPFNRPHFTGKEIRYCEDAINRGDISGTGPYTAACNALLRKSLGSAEVLTTHSAAAALEMSAQLLDLEPGDEVIMPSFTFPSTANSFLHQGAIPVFVDIGRDMPNIDAHYVEQAIGPRTRAIVAVHYAGIPCNMDALSKLAKNKDLLIVEDAAQAWGSSYRNRPAGSLGDLAAFSFQAPKNLVADKAGALAIHSKYLVPRAEQIWQNGTDKSRFLRGEIAEYCWQDIGGAHFPGELSAAFLLAQLEAQHQIQEQRLRLWHHYHALLETAEATELLRRPLVPVDCQHNAHIYYVVLPAAVERSEIQADCRRSGIEVLPHFVPLHDSPAGRRFTRTVGDLRHTKKIGARLLRLPLWIGLTEEAQQRVVKTLLASIRTCLSRHQQPETIAAKDGT